MWNGRGQTCELPSFAVGCVARSRSAAVPVDTDAPVQHHLAVPPAPALVRLHPEPAGPTTVAEAYGVARPPWERRPWTALCMVASIDGATAVGGRSGALGNATDAAVLGAMRAAADVVLVGAGTAAGEGYGAPRKTGLRIGVVTNSGRVDPTRALFTSGAGFVIAPESVEVPAGLDVLRAGTDSVDLGVALARLGDVVPDTRFVSVEGGPRLNAALLEDDLIDEVSVTTSPRLSGGASARLTAGAAEHDRRFALAHLLLDEEHYVFARWVRPAAAS